MSASKTLLLAAVTYAAAWLAPLASSAPAEDGVDWFFGPFNSALLKADAEDKQVLIYFWLPGSGQCVQMYEATFQNESIGEITKDYVCISANNAEDKGAKLFEQFGITTVPAVRVLDLEGNANDGLNGFADIGTLGYELERISRGEGTLSDLIEKTHADSSDLALRNKLAGKYFDLGQIDMHDELQESIKRDDPEGKSLVAANLIYSDITGEVGNEAAKPSDLKLELMYQHVEKVIPTDVVFSCWSYIASVENMLGNFDAEVAAYRKAWENIPEANVLGWGQSKAFWLWSNSDRLDKEGKAFALEMAMKSSERAELVRQDGDDGYGNKFPDEGGDELFAGNLKTLAKCMYMNGDKAGALAVAERCSELDPEGAGPARLVACYKGKKKDAHFDTYADTRPVWSPKGDKLLFTSNRNGNDDIYVASVRGGKETRLTRFLTNEQSATWSPNGKTIAFNRDGFRTNTIYTMDAKGKNVEILVPFDPDKPVGLSDPAYSPDGKRIAFTTTENGKSEIAVMNANGTEHRILTASTPNTDMQPTWSRKGDLITYMSTRAGDSDVYAMQSDGTRDRNVTNASKDSWDMDPEVSPDGKKIVFSSWRSGSLEIYVMDADGGNVKNLTNSPTEDRHPRWSPDGKKIAFDRKTEDGETRIFVMSASGSSPEPLVNG